ncbi:DUF6531 domain-containing protein [Streptomyces flaveolus]|uniref:DUF6531 domain-containing protein n=1 Tax=Streptomyces flaveolus TaxID=67297 RepID=UPI0033EEF7E6
MDEVGDIEPQATVGLVEAEVVVLYEEVGNCSLGLFSAGQGAVLGIDGDGPADGGGGLAVDGAVALAGVAQWSAMHVSFEFAVGTGAEAVLGGVDDAGGELEGLDCVLSDARDGAQARALDVKETCGDPIDMATGQMVLAQTDAHLPGILPLTLRRTHLSGYDAGVFFGPSWASTVDERLEENQESGGIRWYREDGSVLVYPRLPDFVGDRVQPAEGMRLP